MELLRNDRTRPLPGDLGKVRQPSRDAGAARALLARCPVARSTPLVAVPGLGGVGVVWAKDERARMGLGSFKALGAAYVIAHLAQSGDLGGQTFVTASAGNHGLSVAAGAGVFGARAVIFLAETVPEAFADRLRGLGAEVVRAGAAYEASMAAAMAAASANNWTLLSDSSWPGYVDLPHRLMEGYLAMAAEAVEQVAEQVAEQASDQAAWGPTHVLLQAGVGGMAAAVAAHVRETWGDGPTIVVVEPDRAPALLRSVRARRVTETGGAASNMGRLDCKVPSLIALAGLMQDADAFVTITDDEAERALPALADAGLETTPSGGAGLAALLSMPAALRDQLGLDSASRVLAIVSEAA